MTRIIQVAVLCYTMTLVFVWAVSFALWAASSKRGPIVESIAWAVTNDISWAAVSIEGGSIDMPAFEMNVCTSVRSRSPPHVRA